MNELKKAMKQDIMEADLVLVGIGDEFEEKFNNLDLKTDENEKWINEFMKGEYVHHNHDHDTITAYNNLYNLIKDKNYFVVTTCKDGYIMKSNIDKDKLVMPCGNYEKLQCEKSCNEELQEAQEITRNVMDTYRNQNKCDRPKCSICGENLVYNNIYAENYLEKGYMSQWEKYTKWLQGTINRKVCILELGVGLSFPTVIRWPFEKVAFYNNKAKFYRVHSSLYQLPTEISEKGKSCKEDALAFLSHINDIEK